MLTESLSAEEIDFQVGYESPSQFSREYARMFGLPPISDIKHCEFLFLQISFKIDGEKAYRIAFLKTFCDTPVAKIWFIPPPERNCFYDNTANNCDALL